jgi:hypothetical protein
VSPASGAGNAVLGSRSGRGRERWGGEGGGGGGGVVKAGDVGGGVK